MTRIFACLLTLAVLSAFGCGAEHRKRTLEDVRGYCMTSPMCFDDQDQMCQAYVDLLSKPYASAHECREACENFPYTEFVGLGAVGCEDFFEQVTNTCTEYCDDHFPK